MIYLCLLDTCGFPGLGTIQRRTASKVFSLPLRGHRQRVFLLGRGHVHESYKQTLRARKPSWPSRSFVTFVIQLAAAIEPLTH